MTPTKAPTKKAKSKAKRPAATAGTKAKSGSNSRAAGSRPKAKANAPSSRNSTRNGTSAHGASAALKSARGTIDDAGKKAAAAAATTGKAASKAKVPLIAGGAALVGAASGIAITAARAKNTKVLGMSVPKTKVKISSKDLAKAADRVAGAGEQIGRVSTGIREIQGRNGADGGDGRARSPIEVVIQGLTRRH